VVRDGRIKLLNYLGNGRARIVRRVMEDMKRKNILCKIYSNTPDCFHCDIEQLKRELNSKATTVYQVTCFVLFKINKGDYYEF